MLGRIRASLVLRTTLVGVLMALLTALLGLALAGKAARRWELIRQREGLEALVNVVGPSASAACFAQDAVLAEQVVRGLLETGNVHGALLRTDSRVLAEANRPGGLVPVAGVQPVSRTLASPFAPDALVGELILVPDASEAERQGARTATLLRLLLLGVVASLGGVLAVTLHWVIIRPITDLSQRLHAMEADAGGRLAIPRGHDGDEVGQLVGDVNALMDRMVEALWREQEVYQRLIVDKRKVQSLLEHAGAALFVVRGDGALEAWTPTFLQLMGLEAAPPPPGTSFPGMFSSQAGLVAECLARCQATQARATLTLRWKPPGSGIHRWLQVTLDPIGPDWCQGLLDNVTSVQDVAMAGGRLSVRDAATGALNRLGAEHALEERFAAGGRGLGILLVALGGLDAVRESQGQNAVEAVLKGVAQRLAGGLRRSDPVARLEDNEFLVILDLLEEPEVGLRIGNTLLAALAEPFPLPGGLDIKLTACGGLTLRRVGEGASRQVLLHRANQALVEAQLAGGTGCRLRN